MQKEIYFSVKHYCVTFICVHLCQVSAAVCFLLSPAAAFINGETIRVDGAHSLVAPSVVYQVPGVQSCLI